MASPRGFFAAGVVGKTIYVVGGYDGVRELERVDALDLVTGEWSSRAPLSQPRAGLGLASLGSRLYAIGGGRAAPVSYNEQYDVNAGAWSRIDSPVVGEWHSPGVAALGQNVYAVGGWSGDYLDANSAYEAILRLLLPFGSAGK
jgi:kelch-like protein 1/4/5/kelch-like protein 20